MGIDLSLLHSLAVDSVSIDDMYSLPANYYENTDILKLDDCRRRHELQLALRRDERAAPPLKRTQIC